MKYTKILKNKCYSGGCVDTRTWCALLTIISLSASSCKEFLEIDPPKSSLVRETVFQNDGQALAAMTGIYAVMYNSGWASGGQSSIACFASLTSDEFIGYGNQISFYENQIAPDNVAASTTYSGPYKSIHAANAVLEGLAETNGVTPPVKSQLQGEAFFVRAFSYFYLVNLYGPVPLQLSTDYRTTSITSKSTVEQIYHQIVQDLKASEALLLEAYPTATRTRPNKSVVQAFLARVYLYLKEWENAEKFASLVIEKSSTYNLVSLDAIFLANSKEAVWQLMPVPNRNSHEGQLLNLSNNTNIAPTQVSLRGEFALTAFEVNDKRKDAWVRSYIHSTGTYYYPFKYKVQSSTTVTEYGMVLRLAELYLIRAEAKINQEKVSAGIEDLNIVRKRPLPNTGDSNTIQELPLTLNKTEALSALEQERRIELFSEWGHRWFDLKRTGRASAILRPLKPGWQDTDILYPIPQSEINQNSNIAQNAGY